MFVKDLAVKIKAGPDSGLGEGVFEAYASVFGNVDSYGDRVVKGAFEEDLARWKDSGNPIPLLFGHQMSDPDFNIGSIQEAVEDDHGLKVTAQLDLENPKAVQVYRMLKGGRVSQMSFAYDVLDSRQVSADDPDEEKESGSSEGKMWRKTGDKINELTKLRIYEVSVVTIGANQETEILAVKSASQAMLAKAGRTLSGKNESTLRTAHEELTSAASQIKSVLDQLGNDEEKSGQPAGTLTQDQTRGTSEVKSPASGSLPSAGNEEPKTSPGVYLVARYEILRRKGLS